MIDYEDCTRGGTSVSLDRAMSLADDSANKVLCSIQLYVNIVHSQKLIRAVLIHVPPERWFQLMIGGFKTINLAWIKKLDSSISS